MSAESVAKSPEWTISLKFATFYCFRMVFIEVTLSEVYRFDDDDWSNLRWTDQINGTYVSWMDGMALAETNPILAEKVRENVASIL